jgi:MFS family permease
LVNKKTDEYRSIESGGIKGGRGRISLRNLKTFESFKNPVYLRYYGAMGGQWFSLSMQMVIRSLLVYRITGSGAILGTIALMHAVSMLLAAFLGGAIADRVQKKYILLAGLVSMGMVTLGIAIALAMGYLSPEHPESWWLLAASSVLHGFIMGSVMPSSAAIIPEIVREEQIMNAISLNNLEMNFFRLVAPALAGFLADAFDFAFVYYFCTGMYFIAIFFLVSMPRTRAIPVRGSSALADVLAGLRYVWHEKTILIVLAFGIGGTICGMPFAQLMPIFTEDILKVGASGMGIILSVSGAGSILGSLVLASLPNRRRGLMMLLSGLILSLALMGFAYSHWWYPSLAIVVFVGLGQTSNMAISNTLVQHYVDADYRGRMMSFHMMGVAFGSLGTFFAGILSESIGIQWSIGLLAIAFALVSIMGLIFIPRLRKLD